jgi:hypothetical protein
MMSGSEKRSGLSPCHAPSDAAFIGAHSADDADAASSPPPPPAILARQQAIKELCSSVRDESEREEEGESKKKKLARLELGQDSRAQRKYNQLQ